MTVSWKSWPNLFCLCLSLRTTAVLSQTLQLEPVNSTVLQGSDVRFNATVVGQWSAMSWHVAGRFVLSATLAGAVVSTTSTSERFSARLCSSGDISCLEFTIRNVTRGQSGMVACSLLGSTGPSTAELYVQESGTISIVGGSMTVVQDQQVEFQCVTSAWFPAPTVSWTRGGEAVSSGLYNTTSAPHGDSYNSTSVLTFQAVRNTTVACWATVSTLKTPESSSVFLVVVPKPPDWTVLIAVVVSIGGFALLVLLIIGIIFCYRRRKEKQRSYQDEMNKRVRTQSEISVVNADGPGQGHTNAGYVPDGRRSVAPSELTDSGFSQAKDFPSFEMPDIVNSVQVGNSFINASHTVDGLGFKKHRHITIV